MNPLVIFDKSALQMLAPQEVDELRLCFDVICVPTLIREIISDLSKEPTAYGRIPEDVVRHLAMRMSAMHLTTPVTFRKAAISDLRGAKVPMRGQVPVDPSAQNVHASPDGTSLVYEATEEQELWRRWSLGDFSTTDDAVAKSWRGGLSNVNLKALGENWRGFIDEHIGRSETLDEIVQKIDRLISFPSDERQTRMVAVLLLFLRAPTLEAVRFVTVRSIAPRMTLNVFAPYAASILRLYLTFLAAIAYGIIRLKPSNYIDLQYLFYAPFSMGFASNDRLHERLWVAASGSSIFIDGQRLKTDLAARLRWRNALTEEQLRAHHATHSFYPVEMPDSIVSDVWRRWMMPREQFVESLRNRRPLDEVSSEIGPDLKRMLEKMEALKSRKAPGSGDWPLGPGAGLESPEP